MEAAMTAKPGARVMMILGAFFLAFAGFAVIAFFLAFAGFSGDDGKACKGQKKGAKNHHDARSSVGAWLAARACVRATAGTAAAAGLPRSSHQATTPWMAARPSISSSKLAMLHCPLARVCTSDAPPVSRLSRGSSAYSTAASAICCSQALRCETRSGCSRHSSRSEEHTSELQSQSNLVCRLLLEKKKKGGDPASAYLTGKFLLRQNIVLGPDAEGGEIRRGWLMVLTVYFC